MISSLLLGLTLTFSAANTSQLALERPEEVAQSKAGRAALTVDVEGAPCASCSLTLRRALKKLGGVDDIREGAHKKQVIVDFRPQETTADAIVDAINKTDLSARAVHLQ